MPTETAGVQTENIYDTAIKQINYIKLNLLKECYEWLGIDFGETKNDIVYHNYLAETPLSISGSLSGDSTGLDTGSDTGSLDPSLFKKNPNGWDIQKACNWLHANSSPTSQHVCAKYIRMAIEAGGISTTGRPSWAWKYINYLPTIGFKFIGKVNRSQLSSFTPQPGDIAVYQKGGDPNVPGHICMWTGVQWESDFKQRNMFVYQSTQEGYIFRFV